MKRWPPFHNSDGHRTPVGDWLLGFMPVVEIYHEVADLGVACDSLNNGGVRMKGWWVKWDFRLGCVQFSKGWMIWRRPYAFTTRPFKVLGMYFGRWR